MQKPRGAAEEFSGYDDRGNNPGFGVSPMVNDVLTVIDDAKLRGGVAGFV